VSRLCSMSSWPMALVKIFSKYSVPMLEGCIASGS
jgi:hypothetical protein